MKEEWLLRGAAVPVTCETIIELIAEIKRLIDVVGGMALAQPEQEPRPWVELAPEDRLCAKYMLDAPEGIEAVIDYITAKLKEKNT